MFKCKACEAKTAEIEHLRKWIDRLMEQKAPEIKEAVIIDERLTQDEDVLYETQEA